MGISGKLALVTGAGSGIGRTIAEGLAGRGAIVAVNDIKSEAAYRVAEALVSRGLPGRAFPTDISSPENVERMVGAILREYGEIDFLVNNAGIDVIGSVLDTPWPDWRRVLEVNLLGCVYCTRAVAQVMIERQIRGRIVNISSINALLGWRNRSAYSASKAGVNAFTRCAALELGAFRINVNAVAPGAIDTPIWGETLTPAVREAHAKRTAFGRIGSPEDVAGVVAFLLSDEAQYVTGQVIAVDGGRSVTDYVPIV
jgi:3-oxoacyl-[acyl-carrier protein] reductase